MTTGSIWLIICTNFPKLNLPCKSLCLGWLLTFFPKSTLFYWEVDWVSLGIPFSFMGVEFYKEINLVSTKSIFIILNISRKEMVYWVSFGVSWLKYWTANVMLKILFSIHWNYYVSNSMWLIVLKTNVMIVTFNYSPLLIIHFDHSRGRVKCTRGKII